MRWRGPRLFLGAMSEQFLRTRFGGEIVFGVEPYAKWPKCARENVPLDPILDLFVSPYSISDLHSSDVACLNVLSDCERLRWTAEHCDDDAYRRLDVCTSLIELDLRNCNVQSLRPIISARMRSLAVLHLDGTDVSDSDVSVIVQLSALRELHLAGTRVTDAGVSQMLGMRALEYVDLTGCQVTDRCVGTFGELPALAQLFLVDTDVTCTRIRQFSKSRPTVQVSPSCPARSVQ
jgi:hypothetical protein